MKDRKNKNVSSKILLASFVVGVVLQMSTIDTQAYAFGHWYQPTVTAWDHIYDALFLKYERECFEDGTYLNEILNDNITPEGAMLYLDFGYFTEYVDIFKAKGRIPQDYQLPKTFYTITKTGGTYKCGVYRAPYITTDCEYAMKRYEYWLRYYTTGKHEDSSKIMSETYIPKYLLEQQQNAGSQEQGKSEDKKSQYANTKGWDTIFNAEYYAKNNPDVVKAVGNNAKALLNHFKKHGMAEGRQGSPEFNVETYKANYADLQKAYGDNLEKYYMHYMNTGKAEGRTA